MRRQSPHPVYEVQRACGNRGRHMRLCNPAWELGKYVAMKGRNYRKVYQGQVEEHDHRPARGMEPIGSRLSWPWELACWSDAGTSSRVASAVQGAVVPRKPLCGTRSPHGHSHGLRWDIHSTEETA